MLSTIKREFVLWTIEINRLICEEIVDLDPHEYCIGAVLLIAVGFMLLSGRQ
ncbi:MAG: hypothetical protein RIK87_30355 [Fuerstiella sp.]